MSSISGTFHFGLAVLLHLLNDKSNDNSKQRVKDTAEYLNPELYNQISKLRKKIGSKLKGMTKNIRNKVFITLSNSNEVTQT